MHRKTRRQRRAADKRRVIAAHHADPVRRFNPGYWGFRVPGKGADAPCIAAEADQALMGNEKTTSLFGIDTATRIHKIH